MRETAAAGIGLGGECLRLLGFDEAERATAHAHVGHADAERLAWQIERAAEARDRHAMIDSIAPEPVAPRRGLRLLRGAAGKTAVE